MTVRVVITLVIGAVMAGLVVGAVVGHRPDARSRATLEGDVVRASSKRALRMLINDWYDGRIGATYRCSTYEAGFPQAPNHGGPILDGTSRY